MDEAEICDQVAIIDKGKIVAHDTPYNLKKQFTSTRMEMDCSDTEQLIAFLNRLDIKHQVKGEKVTAFVTDVDQIRKIMNENQAIIRDLEVKKGSLNDVFLAITGKEIRE